MGSEEDKKSKNKWCAQRGDFNKRLPLRRRLNGCPCSLPKVSQGVTFQIMIWQAAAALLAPEYFNWSEQSAISRGLRSRSTLCKNEILIWRKCSFFSSKHTHTHTYTKESLGTCTYANTTNRHIGVQTRTHMPTFIYLHRPRKGLQGTLTPDTHNSLLITLSVV